MTRRRSFSRGPESFKRCKPNASGRSFLIVTEGEKTERNYLIALCSRLGLNKGDVVILHPEEGTDPLTLTRKAIELRQKRKKDIKKDPALIDFDEVWVIFDLEDQNSSYREKARQAMALKDANGIQFAISDLSFEYWLLLHEEYTTAQFANCQAVTKRFRIYWGDYDKDWKPPDAFLDKLPDAVKYAELCRRFHSSAKGCGNPSTDVDKLTKNLNAATRSYLQFPLNPILSK